MTEKLNPQIDEYGPETHLEKVENISRLISAAEALFEAEGRESAKLLTPKIYNELMSLNKRDKGDDWRIIWVWNPEGELTEEEFNALNLRRKLLSNAIGIMTASGVVRHDLNEI